MDDDKLVIDKLENKYVGIEPMLLICVIAILIIYYYLFSSLGNNADSRIIAKQGNFSLGDPGYQISILNNDIHGVICAGTGTEQIALFSDENINSLG